MNATKLMKYQAKAMAAFLSGEMKDTVQMNPAGAYGEHSAQYGRSVTKYLWSSRTVLLSERETEVVPKLGR